MPPGVILALLAYGLFSCSDASIKSLGGELSVFEIGFFTSLFAIGPALFSKSRKERWRDVLQFKNPLLLNIRGLSGVLGSACVIYAFTHVPLAEVYSLAFLAPIFVVLLSALLLSEAIPRYRWLLLILSFVGVLIVVRPGFRELQLGHLAALACAFFTATNTVVLRSLAPREHRLSIFTMVSLYALVLNGVGMLVWGSSVPTLPQLGVLALIGTMGGLGHLTFIGATKLAPANQVAPAQYTQMLWALGLGAIFYGEFIDWIGIFGLVIMIGAGALNLLSPETYGRHFTRSGRSGVVRNPLQATRLAEVPIHDCAVAGSGASGTKP
jgi:drug/metabolite transporter (DMT)-like permease